MKNQLMALVSMLSLTSMYANDPFDIFEQHMFERFEEMDKLMAQHMHELKEGLRQGAGLKQPAASRFSIKEEENQVVVKITVGEVKNEEMSVEVDEHERLTVVVKADKNILRLVYNSKSRMLDMRSEEQHISDTKEEGQDSYHSMSVTQQSITLSHMIEVKNVQPTFKDGVLTVVLPYKKAQKIAIVHQ